MATDGQQPSSAGGPDGVDEHPDGHPDLDTLALFDAEELEPRRFERVRAHARTCAGCGAALATLREVRAELAALPTPRMPAGVATRLEAALDAERRARFGPTLPQRSAPGAAPHRHNAPAATGRVSVHGLDGAGRRRRRRRSRVIGLVAAGAVVLAGVGIGSAALHGSTGGVSADRGTTSALAPVTPKDQSAGPARPSLVPSHVFTPNAGAVPQYNRDDIGASLARILADATCGGGNTCGSASAGAMSDSDRRTRCTSELTGTPGVTGSPRAVQFALFEGRPAFVFIFDTDPATASGTERIVVVGSDCGQAAAPEVLFSGP